MRRGQAVLVPVALIVLVGAAWYEAGPNKVIFGPQHLPLRFSHDYHVTTPDEATGAVGEGLDCEFCHENISDSSHASQTDIPGHDTCEGCHEDWIGDEESPASAELCAKCHIVEAGATTEDYKAQIPAPSIIFAHKAHTDAEVACLDCHTQVPNKTLATRDDIPTMDRCIDCHAKNDVSTACKTCHLTNNKGRVQTDLPGGKLKPTRYHQFAIHDADFLRDHAVPARRDRAYCENCHTEDECASCHNGSGRDLRFHPGDFIMTHPLRAKKDDVRCQACHTVQSFCINCHVRSGVAAVNSVNGTGSTGRSFPQTRAAIHVPHPRASDGWLSPTSRNFHGFHAQRNIRACASCHQEQYCVQCHGSAFGTGASSSFGGNPHGPNPERLKGSIAAKQNARACLKCHHPADGSWR